MDVIANMLISIKNGSSAKKASVFVPYSNLKNSIAQCLKKEGYIANFAKKTKKGHPYLELVLVYEDSKPKVREVVRMSKQSRRYYLGVKDIHKVRDGHGIMVLSTPKGILSGRDARRENVGGEVLFKIW